MAKQTKIQTPFSLKANLSVIAAVFSTITNLFAGNPRDVAVELNGSRFLLFMSPVFMRPVSRNTQGVFTSPLVFSRGFWGGGGPQLQLWATIEDCLPRDLEPLATVSS